MNRSNAWLHNLSSTALAEITHFCSMHKHTLWRLAPGCDLSNATLGQLQPVSRIHM